MNDMIGLQTALDSLTKKVQQTGRSTAEYVLLVSAAPEKFGLDVVERGDFLKALRANDRAEYAFLAAERRQKMIDTVIDTEIANGEWVAVFSFQSAEGARHIEVGKLQRSPKTPRDPVEILTELLEAAETCDCASCTADRKSGHGVAERVVGAIGALAGVNSKGGQA